MKMPSLIERDEMALKSRDFIYENVIAIHKEMPTFPLLKGKFPAPFVRNHPGTIFTSPNYTLKGEIFSSICEQSSWHDSRKY
jgi:hypothetical protein